MLSIAAISTMALSCLAASASAAVLYAGGSPTWWSEFRPRVTGINESGGEFSPSNIPGTFGVDYEFLDQVSETRLIIMLIPLVKTTASQFRKDGANIFRIAFLMGASGSYWK